MRFSALIAVLPDDLEQRAIETAKVAGAGGVTIMDARGIGAEARKTFLGMTYEGSQSVLMWVLEKKVALNVLKAVSQDLELEGDPRGVAFTVDIAHLAGIGRKQIEQFQEHVKEEI
ncbi:conserved hypothetical protein [Thioalkalivibrio sp. K90mix]|jgi:hypothetical protein|uniref:P-II family nitrogen regulator n=1 Tax=unclassified Thioalkalivibrio TaxID=2621013 RepID=UPI000195A549|nr:MULTISPECIES: hypothetical protein [unclassified Thioalkalivibrio]ADC71601.1 conserved hypothetical protein [Thioalkalivibrio sp. K90mix]